MNLDCTLFLRVIRPLRAARPPEASASRRTRPAILAALFLLSALIATPLAAQSARSFESALNPEQARAEAERILNKVDPGAFDPEPNTEGFLWRFDSQLFSAFSYGIFGGVVSARNPRTVLRIEGAAGDVRILARILEQENLIPAGSTLFPEREPVALETKSHLSAQGLNLIAPWLGVLYTSWDSPRLTRGQTWFRFLGYFFLDAVLISAAGTNFYQESFDTSKRGGAVAAAVLIPRMLGAWQAADLIRGHNRLAELKYTFYID